jgi:hypothetical protein
MDEERKGREEVLPYEGKGVAGRAFLPTRGELLVFLGAVLGVVGLLLLIPAVGFVIYLTGSGLPEGMVWPAVVEVGCTVVCLGMSVRWVLRGRRMVRERG